MTFHQHMAGARSATASVFHNVLTLPKSGLTLSFTTTLDGRTIAVGRSRGNFRRNAEMAIDVLLEKLNEMDGDADLEPSLGSNDWQRQTGALDLECDDELNEDDGLAEPALGWGPDGETSEHGASLAEEDEPSLGWPTGGEHQLPFNFGGTSDLEENLSSNRNIDATRDGMWE